MRSAMPHSTDSERVAGDGTADLTDPRTHLRPDIAEYWRWMRATRPVHWHAGTNGLPGFWVLSTHRHVMAVYRDTAGFSSQRGNILLTLLADTTPRPARCSR
jgi:hypothetical protein